LKKIVLWLLIMGIVVCLGGIGRTSLRGSREMREHSAVITEELDKIAAYKEEMAAWQDTIQVVGEWMAGLSKEERAGHMGTAARRGREIGKRLEVLDGLTLRSNRKIESRQEKLSGAAERMARGDLIFALVAVALAGGLFVLKRFSRA
jgi:hypothetical protein